MKISIQLFSKYDSRRKLINQMMHGILFLLSVVALIPLLAVLTYVLQRGIGALDVNFFTELPSPVGETGGGMANALAGSAWLILLASLLGIPWGVAAGVYLSEYNYGSLVKVLRFTNDILTSVPSIVVGLFVYAFLVVPFKTFSAYAGAFALAVIMIPVISRTTEEILKLVPDHIREAGLALGISRWKVVLYIVLKAGRRGVITGIMLAIARVAGETAPLLFTSFNNRFWAESFKQPIASLPVQIYTYAISPFDDWQRQAWAGALVLMVFVLGLNLLVRYFFQWRTSGAGSK